MKNNIFDVVTSVHDGDRPTMTITVTGEFDASRVPSFDAAVARDLATVSEIVIDLRATTILDSSALGALVRTCERATEASTTFSTLVERPFQVTLMQITGLVDVLHVVRAAE